MKNTGKKLPNKYIIGGLLFAVILFMTPLIIISSESNQLLLSIYILCNLIVSALFFISLLTLFYVQFFQSLKFGGKKLETENTGTKIDDNEILRELTQYQHVIDLSTILLVIDTNGIIKKVNGNFISLTGYRREEILGRSILDLPSSFQRDNLFEKIQKNVSKKQGWNGEIEYYLSGQTVYTMAVVVPILDSEKKSIDYQVIQYNITKEKTLNEALIKSEKEKDIIMSISHTLIFTHNINGIITNINDAAATIFGSTPDQIIGQPLQTILECNQICDEYYASIKNAKTVTGYLNIINFQQQKKTLHYKSVRDARLGLEHVNVYAIDITEKVKAKNSIDNQMSFMSQIVDESANLICLVDDEKNISFLNKKIKSFFGITESVPINSLNDAISYNRDFLILTGNLHNQSEPNTKYSVHECKITEPASGEIKWFKVQKTLFTDNSKKRFVLIIATDISEKHNAQLELIKARQLVENTLRIRENFIANMSHEIRTPLNAIIGFSELLNDTTVNPQQADYLNTIKVAGQNLLSIINDILDLSKLESGNIQISKTKTDIRNLVATVKKLFEPRVLEKQITMTLVVDDAIPEFLLADEMRLNQVLINLVANAIKFTEKGNVEIKVTKGNADNSCTSHLVFQIKDTGIGIEKDKLDIIFQRYSQANEEIHRLYGGTGLGLSISKSLIELLGGEIKLSSELGIGTTFSFTLPLNFIEDTSSTACPVERNEHDLLTPLKILLAEDNNTNAKLAIQVLKKTPHHVFHVRDGLEVLEELKKNHYDIILMDVQMVHMDGIEAAKYIRESGELYANIPIIALTAHSFKGERGICDKVGMDAYLSKPYRPQELLNCINNTMNTSIRKWKESNEMIILN